jgi:preprotein translocase subunit SecA
MYRRPQRLPSSTLERPQKQIEQQKRMVRWWRTLTAYSSRPLRSSVWFYKPLLWRIKAKDVEFRALSDQQLIERTALIRAQLHSQGVSNAQLINGFALIREVAGRELGMWHFDSQIMGGLAILHGNIGQMQTGEGKTLTATLPVAIAALTGIPTHVITVNDYLTERDAATMLPVYERLGLSVGVVTQGLQLEERKEQYRRDIVYCTNNELAFDYLKDRIQLTGCSEALELHAMRVVPSERSEKIDNLMLRGLHFAVVDEADSVCMDEATTPLIISGEETPQAGLERMYQQGYSLVELLIDGEDYKLTKQQRIIDITPLGEDKIEQLTAEFGALWQGRVRRLELVKQALTACYLFEEDKHYLVEENRIIIIDEHTGRRMPDRTWERGLHQLIEIKEGCELSNPRETLASISFQNFFRHYHHLAGMTGTADEVKSEFWRVYGLPVVDVPTHKASQRQLLGEEVHATEEQKWLAVVSRTRELQQKSERPILIGTQSLKASETLSRKLTEYGIEHQVLNARQDQEEADVISQAGEKRRVTIATSMAGRGTDIKLEAETESQGGLHVIITGLHDSSRVDRQLEGRSARQGDRGSYELIISLEDSVLSPGWSKILTVFSRIPMPSSMKNKLLLTIVRRCQSRIEKQHERMRTELLKQDEQQQDTLSYSDKKV